MDRFLRGFQETAGNTFDQEYLFKHRKYFGQLVEKFAAAENVIIGFPLYVDAMPGSVKEFIEALEPLTGRKNLPALGFVVQCGFPETAHLRFVARYCEKLARRLGCQPLGSILKGGCEGLDVQPDFLKAKYFSSFYAIGAHFGKTGNFDETLLKKLAHPEHLKAENMLQLIPFINQGLWDAQMEKNNVLDKSFDRPLLP